MANAFASKIQATKKTKAPNSKKKVIPVVNLPKLTSTMEDFIKAKKAEKIAKADKEFAAATLIERVRSEQDKRAFKGDFAKSFDLIGNDDVVVKYVSVDKFSVINEDDVEFLQGILGDSFESLVNEDTSVTLKSDVFEDEEKQELLMKLIGDHWDDFFDTTSVIKTKTDFDSKIYGAVKNQKELDQVRTLIKQTKSSIR